MMKELVLVIGGSDSSGGAGIQADIKSITVHGAYAASAITSITSQNTQGVQEIFDLPTDLIVSQIDSCLLYTSPSPRDRTRSRMPSSA